MLETVTGHGDTHIMKTSVCPQGIHNQVGGGRHTKSLSTERGNFLGVGMEAGTAYSGDTEEEKVGFIEWFTEVAIRPSHKLVSFSQLHQFYPSYSFKINENNLINKMNESSQAQKIQAMIL